VFAQEYLADFLDEVAGVFHGVDACVHGELYEPTPAAAGHTPHRFAIGVDLAKHSDFTVIFAVDIDAVRDGQVTPHVCAFTRLNTLDWSLQMDMIAQQSALYNAPVLLDSTGIGDPIHDVLRARGVPVFPYLLLGQRKSQLIQNLSVTIQTKGVSFPDIQVLRQELASYQYSVSPSGNFLYSAPDGDHDDTVIALGLAVWAAQHYPGQGTPRFIVEDDPLEDTISPI
jgi:phage FluMu gp28-like protein